jgi:hypothetical protein
VSDRVVAVLVPAPPAAPDARSIPAELSVAMLEDVVDLVAETPQVTGALAVEAGAESRAEAVAWPGTAIARVNDPGGLVDALESVRGLAAVAVAIVVADVPDLPTLLLGKLFSALAGPPLLDLALCPADGGGLVAAAMPISGPAQWLRDLDVSLDDVDAVDRLRAAAPRRALGIGPGWHRIRSRSDLALLDAGLEGWDHTRALAQP